MQESRLSQTEKVKEQFEQKQLPGDSLATEIMAEETGEVTHLK